MAGNTSLLVHTMITASRKRNMFSLPGDQWELLDTQGIRSSDAPSEAVQSTCFYRGLVWAIGIEAITAMFIATVAIILRH